MEVTKPDTRVTQSGVVVRSDSGIGGLLCYTRYSALIYAVPEDHAVRVVDWLDGKHQAPPDQIYAATLGIGWSTARPKPFYPVPQLLPDANSWPVVPSPERPILINWFITGRCPLACKYCYA